VNDPGILAAKILKALETDDLPVLEAELGRSVATPVELETWRMERLDLLEALRDDLRGRLLHRGTEGGMEGLEAPLKLLRHLAGTGTRSSLPAQRSSDSRPAAFDSSGTAARSGRRRQDNCRRSTGPARTPSGHPRCLPRASRAGPEDRT
jgi:hypothetical protein